MYVRNKHIGKSRRFLSDIIEIAKIKKLDCFLVAMDIENNFDSLDHDFLTLTLEEYGFGKNFILWAKILLRDQESCVINRGTTTNIFYLGEELVKVTQFQLFYLFYL